MLRLLLVLLCLSASAPTAASAQSQEDVARARALFSAGVELMDQGQHREAAERFQECLSIRSAAAVHFNLALALLEIGLPGRAVNHFERVVSDRRAPRLMRRESRRAVRRMRGQLGTITVNIVGDDAGTTVAIDDWPVPPDRYGTRIRVLAGEHRLSAERDGRGGGRQVLVPEGEDVPVTLRLGAPSPEQAALAGIDAETPTDRPVEQEGEQSGGSVFATWWFWTAVAVVVAATIVTVIVLQPDDASPVQGDLNPPFVELMP